MNTKKIAFAAVSFIGFAFFSCSDISNLTVPKSITVKSSGAEYNLPLGSVQFDISDKLSASDLQETIGDTAAIYDFNAGGADTVQEYIINYPISSIPLDFGSYLDDLDLLAPTAGEVSSWEFSQEAPSVSFEKSVDSNLDEKINSSFSCEGKSISIPEPGSGITWSLTNDSYFPSGVAISITILSPSFSTMEYYSGSINVVVGAPDTTPTTGFEFVAKAVLKVDGVEVASSGDATDITGGGTLSIPLTGVTLKPAISIVFDGHVKGGTLSTTHSYSVSSGITEDTKIKKITGLTMDSSELDGADVLSVDEAIDTGSISDYLISATISEGSISYNVVFPDGWTGITGVSTVALTGGMAVDPDDFTDVVDSSKNYLLNKKADLNGVTLTPQTAISLSGTVTLTISNATIIFDETGKVSIPIKGDCSISKLGETTVNIDNLVGSDVDNLDNTSDLSKSVSQDLPSEVQKYIKKIVFAEDTETGTPTLGFTGTVDSNLDVKYMTLKVGVTSAMFGMDAATNKDSLDLSTLDTDNSFTIKQENEVTVVPETNSTVDIQADVSIIGNDTSNPSYITFNSFEFGKNYYLTPSYELSYNWTEITLNTANTPLTDTISTGLNLGSILDSFLSEDDSGLLDNVKFNDINAYLYVKEPVYTGTGTSPLSGINMGGKIQAVNCILNEGGDIESTETITDGGTAITNDGYLIGSSSDSDTFTIIQDDDAVDFAALSSANENGTITTAKATLFNDGTDDADAKNYSVKFNNTTITDVINAKPENLGLYYDITLGDSDDTLTLTKAQVNSLTSSSGTTSINMNIAIVFPLSFTVTAAIENVDVLALSGNEITDDLLNRDSADDSSDWQEYADLVKSIKLKYKIINPTEISFSAIFSDTNTITKQLTCDDEYHILSLSDTEIDSIFTDYPFTPSVLMTIGAGTFSVPRNATFGVEATLSAETDGEYTVWGDVE